MAAKKTAKKTTEPVSKAPEKAAAPVTKKAAKKAVVPKAAAAPKAEKAAAPKKAASQPTSEAIARAAYLIYRRRVEMGLPGDSHNDWLEAERQLGVVR